MMQRAQCELFPNEAPRELQPNPMGTTAQREGGPAPKDVEELAGAVSQRVDEE